ncbi:hypothetical protein SRHO_G00045340 [Serrasalmus rhombeus]
MFWHLCELHGGDIYLRENSLHHVEDSAGQRRTADILALTNCIQQGQPWQGMTQEVSTSSQGLPNISIHTPSRGGGTVCWPPTQALL